MEFKPQQRKLSFYKHENNMQIARGAFPMNYINKIISNLG